MTNGGGKGRFSRLALLLLLHLALQPLCCVLKVAVRLLRRVVESFRRVQVAPRLVQVHCGWLADPPVARQGVLVLVGARRGEGFWSKL